MAPKRDNVRNANYNFQVQDEPLRRMGANDFANMPGRPMFMEFSPKNGYRDGIINSFTTDIREISDISENQK